MSELPDFTAVHDKDVVVNTDGEAPGGLDPGNDPIDPPTDAHAFATNSAALALGCGSPDGLPDNASFSAGFERPAGAARLAQRRQRPQRDAAGDDRRPGDRSALPPRAATRSSASATRVVLGSPYTCDDAGEAAIWGVRVAVDAARDLQSVTFRREENGQPAVVTIFGAYALPPRR